MPPDKPAATSTSDARPRPLDPRPGNYGHSKGGRFVWTASLHAGFERAVEACGGVKHVTPLQILHHIQQEIRSGMTHLHESGQGELTLSHIKSHLQKYRLKVAANGLPPAPRHTWGRGEATGIVRGAGTSSGAEHQAGASSTDDIDHALGAEPPLSCSQAADAQAVPTLQVLAPTQVEMLGAAQGEGPSPAQPYEVVVSRIVGDIVVEGVD